MEEDEVVEARIVVAEAAPGTVAVGNLTKLTVEFLLLQ